MDQKPNPDLMVSCPYSKSCR